MKSRGGCWGKTTYKPNLYKFQIQPKSNKYQRRMFFLPSGKKIHYIALPSTEALRSQMYPHT